MSNEPTPITTVISEVPQLQTVMQDGLAPISTIVNAPWVSVTSVNGMTGDVTLQLILSNFEPNHYYPQNTAIIYDGSLYYAKESFTSGADFNVNDWNYPVSSQEQTDWDVTDTTSVSYIKNKPTKLSQFTNDELFTTSEEVSKAINDGIAPLSDNVENLESEIEGLNTAISDINTSLSDVDSKATSAQENIVTLNETVESLDTTVENMKTDGSVTKLGTQTIGNTSKPIYWNSGHPAETTVTTSGLTKNAIVGIDDSRQTIISENISMKDSDGSTLRTITASSNGLVSDGNIYINSIADNNRLVKVSELSSAGSGDGWTLISKYIATSSTTSSQIYASVPSSYRGYPWEYKVIVGFEIAPEGGDVIMTVDGTNGKYSSALSGYRDGNIYDESLKNTADWMGIKWPCLVTNDSCAGEVLVTRAGSDNYWIFKGTGGGFSSAKPCTITFGGRIEDNANITYFNLNKSYSGGAWLAGSHIEIYARKYI